MTQNITVFNSAKLFCPVDTCDDIFIGSRNLSLFVINEILAGQGYDVKKSFIETLDIDQRSNAISRIFDNNISSLVFASDSQPDIVALLKDILPKIKPEVANEASLVILKIIAAKEAFSATREILKKEEINMELVVGICSGILLFAVAWIFFLKNKSMDVKQVLEILEEYHNSNKNPSLSWIVTIAKTIPISVTKTNWTWEYGWKNAKLNEEQIMHAIVFLSKNISGFSSYIPSKGEQFDGGKMQQRNDEKLPYILCTDRDGLISPSGNVLEKAVVICATSDYLALNSIKSDAKKKFINKYQVDSKTRDFNLSKMQMDWLDSEIDYSKMSCFIKDLITNSPAGDLKEIAEVNARFSEYKMNSLEQPQANAVVSHVEHAGLEKAGDVLLKAMVHIKIQEQ